MESWCGILALVIATLCSATLPPPANNGFQGTKEQLQVIEAFSSAIKEHLMTSQARDRPLVSFLSSSPNIKHSAIQAVLNDPHYNNNNKNNHKQQHMGHGGHHNDQNHHHHHDWDYNSCSNVGPKQWGSSFPQCNGLHQSPINIVTNQVEYGKRFKTWYYMPKQSTLEVVVKNNGHAPTVKMLNLNMPSYRLYEVPYSEGQEYILAQFHIHFSKQYGEGSEHRVDGEGFDGEIHLVHYNSKYSNLAEAMHKSDGLAVIGVFLEVGQTPNSAVADIIGSCAKVVNGDTEANVTIHSLDFLRHLNHFYTYRGSLTAPGCEESVRWIVMKDPVQIPLRSIQILHMLKDHQGSQICDHGNIRPVQHKNGRIVEANFMPDRLVKPTTPSNKVQKDITHTSNATTPKPDTKPIQAAAIRKRPISQPKSNQIQSNHANAVQEQTHLSQNQSREHSAKAESLVHNSEYVDNGRHQYAGEIYNQNGASVGVYLEPNEGPGEFTSRGQGQGMKPNPQENAYTEPGEGPGELIVSGPSYSQMSGSISPQTLAGLHLVNEFLA
ncbi:hypothetical protein ACJMK2_023865 [Sinanodonta woodiana]|uniref:Carbonic anhydrase n=1 Tax=Sinanodonta woodiana TaxID=1069815 RepID=A0ABD3T5J5_SINWO